MECSREPTTLVRILVSEREELFFDVIAGLTHGIARLPITVATIVPKTAKEVDLLETAAQQNFDLAILFLNNILYSSGCRDRAPDESIALVRNLVRLFHKPIIGVYAWPDSPGYPSQILGAGATAVLRAPWDNDEMQQSLKRCLNIW